VVLRANPQTVTVIATSGWAGREPIIPLHPKKMTPQPHTVRDHGLALISRINRWLIVAAVAFSGLISLVAAHAFHGRTVSAAGSSGGAAAPLRQSQSSAGGGAAAGGGSAARLQPPAQAPASIPAAPSAPIVSGGS
jgi:hypothetical protein